MVELKKLNGDPIFVNPHLIITMEGSGDTRLFFTSGTQLLVKETPQEVIECIVEYRKKLGQLGSDI